MSSFNTIVDSNTQLSIITKSKISQVDFYYDTCYIFKKFSERHPVLKLAQSTWVVHGVMSNSLKGISRWLTYRGIYVTK